MADRARRSPPASVRTRDGQADPDRTGAERYPIDRDTDPGTWWAAVYDDVSIVTQYDDGAGRVADGRGIPTSSPSAPGVVTAFLELLDVHAGHRVLDVGTGTG
ncbi:hypothetical protein [Actinomadura miaoliensis]|uniref:Methyltransferase n=1 Tax=Actinomadura miaoliensis TaxID=430685 RepID=A0ABP7UVI6_9ACTN